MSKNAITCAHRYPKQGVTIYSYNNHTVACEHVRAEKPYDLMLMLRTFVRIIPITNSTLDYTRARNYKGTSFAEALREYFRTNAPVVYNV